MFRFQKFTPRGARRRLKMSEMYDLRIEVLKYRTREDLERALEEIRRDNDIMNEISDVDLVETDDGRVGIQIDPGYVSRPEMGEYIAQHLTKNGVEAYIDMFCIDWGLMWYIRTDGRGDYTMGRMRRDDGSRISWLEVPWEEEKEEGGMEL